MLKRFVASVAVAVMLTRAAVAGPFEDGAAAVERGDYATALRLWQPLAEQGDVAAQNNLGAMYENGDGVPRDYAEAARWYRIAADQGHAGAQFNLGVMYAKGRGVPQDYAEAVKWFRLGADQGYAKAQYNLGIVYAEGEGVPQDDVLAHMWFNLSAAQGGIEAAKTNRDIIASRMTPDQRAEAQRLARDWKPVAER